MERTAHVADVGDVIVIAGHRVGEAERTAEILEVLGDVPNERFRVRWADGHESVIRPGSDATIRRPARRPSARKAKR